MDGVKGVAFSWSLLVLLKDLAWRWSMLRRASSWWRLIDELVKKRCRTEYRVFSTDENFDGPYLNEMLRFMSLAGKCDDESLQSTVHQVLLL